MRHMLNKRKSVKCFLAAAAALAAASSMAHATALVNLQILGSTDGTHFSSSLSGVTPGQTISFEVLGEIDQSPDTNSNHPWTLVQPQVSGTDGISSLNYNLSLSDTGATFKSSSTGPDFTNTLGSSGGTAAGNNLTAVNDSPATPGAFYGGTATDMLLSGTFTAGSASTDTMTYSFNSGAFKANTTAGQKGITASPTTETGTDPYIVAAPLAVSEASPVPEPASLAVFAVGAMGLLIRRRQAV
jgi:hypothetical protein